jgi:hypothetical protein
LTGILDPILKARALQELARGLPAGARDQASLFWDNDQGGAGVTITNTGCTVFLFDAEQEVASLSEAGELLRRIFADEIMAVRAYANEVFVYSGLAPVNDPSAGFNSLISGTSRSVSMPEIDYVAKATWSRGYFEDTE